MRVGFDLRPAVKKNSAKRGVGRYTLEVFRALLPEKNRFGLIAYLTKELEISLGLDFESRILPYLKKPSRLNWILDRFLLPRQFKKDRLDLFHATDLVVLPKPTRTQVWMTIHDLIPFVFWEETVRSVPRDFAFMLERVWKQLSHIDRIITSSKFSKKDICERTGIDAEKVSVVYLGCNQNMQPVSTAEAGSRLSREYGITSKFLFYLGGTDHRKNLPLLLKAFARIQKKGYPGCLVLGGETFLMGIPEVQEIIELSEKLGIKSRLVLPGYIPDQDLPCFFSACDFFVFPSLYEGFGLPVLEALRCGAPVLASDSSSIPEVAGEGAVYFDPKNENDLVNVFWDTYENREAIEYRKELGFKQAERFSWQKTAEDIIHLYQEFGVKN